MRRIRTIKVMDGGSLRTVAIFAAPLSLSILTSPVTGDGYNGGNPTTVTSENAVAAPSGGLSPFTYAWAQLSGDAMTINSPSSASTTFSAIVGFNTSKTGTFRCTCTDSVGSTATADVTCTLSNI